MRILWVKAGGLVPPDTGGKIRSYNILRQLAQDHAVTVFSFHAAHVGDAHADLQRYFERVESVPLRLPQRRSFAETRQWLRHLLTREPYAVRKYCRPEVLARLRQLLREDSFDVIVCDFMVAGGAIPWDCKTPIVLFTHNVEALLWKRHYEIATNPLWRALCWREWRTTERTERHYLTLADHVLAVSETDRSFFERWIDASKLTVVQTGVDVDYFRPDPAAEQPRSLVFTGSMDWMPNEDGILYFGEHILPRLKQQLPDVSVCVVGREPPASVRALAAAEKCVQLTGWVEDIRPYLARGSVCIVPLRVGSGTRLKIFEAMAMGKAVVSTTLGAEGLPVRDGEHIVLADAPDEFAAAVVGLLRDPTRRAALGNAARQLVETNYGWSRVGKDFSAILERVVGAGLKGRE
jgi:polysaccharide biosynthesis protein PslH